MSDTLFLPDSVRAQIAVDRQQRHLKSVRVVAEREASVNPTLTALKLDTNRTSWVGAKGDLAVYLADKDLSDGHGRRPHLLIVNKRSPTTNHVFFAMADLWVILEKHAEQVAVAMCEKLYGHATRDDAFRVLDVLFEYAEELKNAKPPRWLSSQQWLTALAEDGFTVWHQGKALNG